MSKQDQVGKHRTTVSTDPSGITSVTYHTTQVVSWSGSAITLRTGGWRSPTTKLRMNQTSRQYDLGFSVYQTDFEWFVNYRGSTISFDSETMTLERRHNILVAHGPGFFSRIHGLIL